MDVYSVCETYIQDPSMAIKFFSPGHSSESSKFALQVLGDTVISSRELAGAGITSSCRAESALLDWIPVNGRLYAV
ncbi:unnamed protein product [Heterobilharzia americana]|nr:unnamed protein product [Heterobilharzia americana]